MSYDDTIEQVYDIAYGNNRERIPRHGQNVAYAKAVRSLYARHGFGILPDHEERLQQHERSGGYVTTTTRHALIAGITPLEIIAVARLAYPKGNP